MNWPARAQLRRSSVALFTSLSLLLGAAGCEDPNNIGVELPGTAAITTQYQDYAVQAATVRRDSLPTLRTTRLLAGRVRDNNTGIVTTARAYANLQLGLDALPATYTGTVLDSLVLTLGFERVYGNSLTPARFDVYQLTQKLDERTAYNASSAPPLGPLLVGGATGLLNQTRKDTTNSTGVVQRPTCCACPFPARPRPLARRCSGFCRMPASARASWTISGRATHWCQAWATPAP